MGSQTPYLGPYLDPLLEGYMGLNHIDARLGVQCNYGVLGTPIWGYPQSGVWDLGTPRLGVPRYEVPRWSYGETGHCTNPGTPDGVPGLVQRSNSESPRMANAILGLSLLTNVRTSPL